MRTSAKALVVVAITVMSAMFSASAYADPADEPHSPDAITVTRACAGGPTITFTFGGIGAQWAVHVDAIDGVPTGGIFVITYWSVYNPTTDTLIVVRDLPAGRSVMTCMFTTATGRVVTAKLLVTPQGPD